MRLLGQKTGLTYACEDTPAFRGGESAVFRARRAQDERSFAVKMAADPRRERPLLDERDVLEALLGAHPDLARFVVPLIDWGSHDGAAFLVFPWFEPTLHDWLGQGRSLEERLEALAALALAVSNLHYRQDHSPRGAVVHRDVKPGNAFVIAEAGELRVLLSDFGIARPQGRAGLNTGVFTAGFAPPEQPLFTFVERADPSWDTYALAASVFAGIVGRPPLSVSGSYACLTTQGQRLRGLVEKAHDDGDLEAHVEARVLCRLPVGELVDVEALRPLGEGDLPALEAAIRGMLAGRVRSPDALAHGLALDLGRVLARAMEPDPARRGADPRNIHEACLAALADVRDAVAGRPTRHDFPAMMRSRRRLAAGAAIAVLALVGAVTLLLRPRDVAVEVQALPAWASVGARLERVGDLPIEGVARGPRLAFDSVPSGEWTLVVDGQLDSGGRCAFSREAAIDVPWGVGGLTRQVTLAPAPSCPTAEAGYSTVRVDPGEVVMGSPDDEVGRAADEVLRKAVLARGFHLGSTEVDQRFWRRVMGGNPTADARVGVPEERLTACDTILGVKLVGDDLPVVCVTWCEALRFANLLSVAEGLPEVYTVGADCETGGTVSWDVDASGWRLPTEAEWEYAARAGDQHPLYAGLPMASNAAARPEADALACRFDNVPDRALARELGHDGTLFPCDDGFAGLAPVGSFVPNAWGLYDITGNAREWVWDGYDAAPVTGLVPPEGLPLRVVRGGSFYDHLFQRDSVRLANRGASGPGTRSLLVGLRLARTLEEP